jgi:hypothetical protein
LNLTGELVSLPSVTVMRMSANVPIAEEAGVPLRRPVRASKLAQPGLFETANLSVSPSGSLAVGLNSYSRPTLALPAGAPEIVGARFGGGVGSDGVGGDDAVSSRFLSSSKHPPSIDVAASAQASAAILAGEP